MQTVAQTLKDEPHQILLDEELALLAKALGHPVRVRIVRLLAHRDGCMYGDLAQQLPLAQSTVSQHLKVLKEAGLVRGEIEGPRTCYCLDTAALRRINDLVEAL
jgi:ArsR family transcriptional regulator